MSVNKCGMTTREEPIGCLASRRDDKDATQKENPQGRGRGEVLTGDKHRGQGQGRDRELKAGMTTETRGKEAVARDGAEMVIEHRLRTEPGQKADKSAKIQPRFATLNCKSLSTNFDYTMSLAGSHATTFIQEVWLQ